MKSKVVPAMTEVETEMLVDMDVDSLFGLSYFSETAVLSPDDGFFYLFLGRTRRPAHGWYSLSGRFFRIYEITWVSSYAQRTSPVRDR